jgi:hypothetical protein
MIKIGVDSEWTKKQRKLTQIYVPCIYTDAVTWDLKADRIPPPQPLQGLPDQARAKSVQRIDLQGVAERLSFSPPTDLRMKQVSASPFSNFWEEKSRTGNGRAPGAYRMIRGRAIDAASLPPSLAIHSVPLELRSTLKTTACLSGSKDRRS